MSCWRYQPESLLKINPNWFDNLFRPPDQPVDKHLASIPAVTNSIHPLVPSMTCKSLRGKLLYSTTIIEYTKHIKLLMFYVNLFSYHGDTFFPFISCFLHFSTMPNTRDIFCSQHSMCQTLPFFLHLIDANECVGLISSTILVTGSCQLRSIS